VNYYVWIGTLLVLAAVTDRPTGTPVSAGR